MREADVDAELLGEGGPFELVTEDVLGEAMRVFQRRPRALTELLARSVVEHGEREFLVQGPLRLTFREHATRVGEVAALLAEDGVGPGDRVAILGENSVAWIVGFFAATSLGAVAVAMNAWWAASELRFGLDDSAPKVLLADDKRLARLGAPPEGLRVRRLEALLDGAAGRAPPPAAAIAEDDPAVILYTSGTTGRSKGAMLSHRNLLGLVSIQSFQGARLARLMGAQPGYAPPPPVLLSANPLFHVSGLAAGVIAHLAWGAKSVWLAGKFDAEQTLRLIEQERVTGWAPHGSMAYKVLHHPDRARYDVSSVKSLGSGGAPVTPEIQRALREAFPNVTFAMAVGYGLTEASALATLNYGEQLSAHPTSVGRPLPTVELAIRDATGRALPDGEEGEITLRGPLVMLGYWRRPDETAAMFHPGRWLRTGDVGRVVDGRLTLETRKRDLILRGAVNVSPTEIEARLAAHPDVAEAAVIGVASAELGEEVKAVVVPRAGAVLDSAALSAWVADALAYFKVPAHWEVRQAPLPRNATGKVMKYLLQSGAESPLVED
ncbi:MAG: AMP-binding protein [Polyangiaceae bacterium]|nr:AMP-binding protein [Polyangiaceae bacterium]